MYRKKEQKMIFKTKEKNNKNIRNKGKNEKD